MTHKHKDQKLDKLKADVATASNGTKVEADPIPDVFDKLTADHEQLRKELDSLKAGFGETVESGRKELKSEIKRHPFQSVLSAFALGVAASLILRR